MNFLDIAIVIFALLLIVATRIFMKDEINEVYMIVIVILIIASAMVSFLVVDKGAGSTIGEITSVDKNFFGTTAVYVKTSETSQEIYCIEDEEVANKAQELIGKRVRIYYGERVGLYSTGKCSQAPVSKIEEVGNEKDNDKSANEG